MNKIEELKKLLWILDSKHNVSIPQTKENIDFIADEIVKLFATPDVMKSVCPDCKGNGWTIPSDRVPYDCKKCNGTGQTVL